MTFEQQMPIPIVTWRTHEDVSGSGAEQVCRGPGSSGALENHPLPAISFMEGALTAHKALYQALYTPSYLSQLLCCYAHCADEETEVQRGSVAHPRWHSKSAVDPGLV